MLEHLPRQGLKGSVPGPTTVVAGKHDLSTAFSSLVTADNFLLKGVPDICGYRAGVVTASDKKHMFYHNRLAKT